MATYIELRNLTSGTTESDTLRNRVEAATTISVEAILADGVSTVDQLQWANAVLGSLTSESQKVFLLVIAKNKGATVEQITGADDATLQAQVDSITNSLVLAYNSNDTV